MATSSGEISNDEQQRIKQLETRSEKVSDELCFILHLQTTYYEHFFENHLANTSTYFGLSSYHASGHARMNITVVKHWRCL